MIVNIRGTSGSGKSHLVRTFMEAHPGWVPEFVEKRRQPLGYTLGNVHVVGHYLCASGGADTLRPLDYIAEVITKQATYHHVLFESLMWGGEKKRTLQLADTFDFRVIGIDYPVEQCLVAINDRRKLKDPDALPVNPKKTMEKAREVERALDVIKTKATVVVQTREEAAVQLEQWLGGEL